MVEITIPVGPHPAYVLQSLLVGCQDDANKLKMTGAVVVNGTAAIRTKGPENNSFVIFRSFPKSDFSDLVQLNMCNQVT